MDQPVQSVKLPSKNILIIILAVVITGLIVGGGVYFWQKTDSAATEKYLYDRISLLEEQVEELGNQSADISSYYKKFQSSFLVSFEIPKTWSILNVPERRGTDKLMDLPTISVGQEDIMIDDTNWNQIDFYYATDDIVDALIQRAKDSKYFNGSWDVEMVGGIKADVAIFPLENGEVTKGGSGGKTYYIRLPVDMSSSGDKVRTLVISKQALGNKEFEDGFKHLIESINFLNN